MHLLKKYFIIHNFYMHARSQLPKVWLFFGCRTRNLDLYYEEKESLLKQGILDKTFLALSRENNVPKVKNN